MKNLKTYHELNEAAKKGISTPEEKTEFLTAYMSWTGGFDPASDDEIETYLKNNTEYNAAAVEAWLKAADAWPFRDDDVEEIPATAKEYKKLVAAIEASWKNK